MEGQQTRILVVEDELLIRTLTKRAFVKEFFACDAAEDGREATEMYRQHPYDVVITDLNMPRKDGHLFVCELLEMSTQPIIIVISACSDPRMERDLRARGVDGFFLKPVDYKEVIAHVQGLLDERMQGLLNNSDNWSG